MGATHGTDPNAKITVHPKGRCTLYDTCHLHTPYTHDLAYTCTRPTPRINLTLNSPWRRLLTVLRASELKDRPERRYLFPFMESGGVTQASLTQLSGVEVYVSPRTSSQGAEVMQGARKPERQLEGPAEMMIALATAAAKRS